MTPLYLPLPSPLIPHFVGACGSASRRPRLGILDSVKGLEDHFTDGETEGQREGSGLRGGRCPEQWEA